MKMMRYVRPGARFVFSLLLLWDLVPLVRAENAKPTRMARLTYVQGLVQVQRTDNAEAGPAPQNMPLAEGWRLIAGDDAQAEIEFEDGSLVRLTPSSAITLDRLGVDASGACDTRLSVVHGLVYLELRALPRYRYLVDAGGDLISPLTNATIRVNLDTPPAVVSVLDGTAHLEKEDGYRADVHAGESLHSDVADADRYFLTSGIDQESWDGWNEARDQAAADQVANSTVARDGYAGNAGYGWSDLDANGNWYDVPGQGRVWQPDVAYDDSFDPYGYGNWVLYPGVGYVWASGYGWGWTPFRCGSWSYWNGFGWGWMPSAGCSRFGWGFGAGGVYTINIQRYRLHLPPVRVPVRGPGSIAPIIAVHTAVVPRPPVTARGPRTIAEHTVVPLPRSGGAYTPRGGSAVGSALKRDYPVDLQTHTPLLGYTTAPPTGAIVPGTGWRNSPTQRAAQPANPGPGPASRQAGHVGAAGGSVHSDLAPAALRPSYNPSTLAPTEQRQRDTTAPHPAPQPSYSPHSQPAPAPAPRAAPAPAPAPAPHAEAAKPSKS